MLVETSLAV